MAKKAIKKTVKKPAAKAKVKKAPLFPGFFKDKLSKTDPKVAKAIAQELHRQQNEIELIASENIVSRAVMEAQGSIMTNKYAEGYPGPALYGCCHILDVRKTSPSSAPQAFDCSSPTSSPIGAHPISRVLAPSVPGTLHGPRSRCGGH